MKIAILGNCQSGGLQKCLAALMPGGTAESFFEHGLAQRFQNRNDLFGELRRFDHVFFHRTDRAMFYGTTADLLENIPDAREVPAIAFTGFHPDMVYVALGDTGSNVKSPVGDNHSALALFAFQEGLTEKQALKLYCHDVFKRTGLLDFWQASVKSLVEAGKQTGCPTGQLFVRWTRHGCFMHTLNHPKIFALADVARWMLTSVGLSPRDVRAENFVIDDLMTSTIWPVYEPIAQEFGVPGSSLFKREMETRFFDLQEFISASYEIYRMFEPSHLKCWLPRMWQSNPELKNWLVEFARG
jgi:hypothetical protein